MFKFSNVAKTLSNRLQSYLKRVPNEQRVILKNILQVLWEDKSLWRYVRDLVLLFGFIDSLKIAFDLSNSTNNGLDSLTFPLQVKSAVTDRA